MRSREFGTPVQDLSLKATTGPRERRPGRHRRSDRMGVRFSPAQRQPRPWKFVLLKLVQGRLAVMKKRMFLMLLAVAVFVAALGTVKARQIRGAMAQHASFQPPPESVTTTVARQEEWPATVSAIGTVTAVQGVTVSADLPGVVEKINFESG